MQLIESLSFPASFRTRHDEEEGGHEQLDQKANGVTDFAPKRVSEIRSKPCAEQNGPNHNCGRGDGANWAKVKEKKKPRQ